MKHRTTSLVALFVIESPLRGACRCGRREHVDVIVSTGLDAKVVNSNVIVSHWRRSTTREAIGGFYGFANFISTTPDKIEEKFYNINIVQDDVLAWVQFDFEFYDNDKVTNHGVEAWQLHKSDGKWKIFSVIWSSHAPV